MPIYKPSGSKKFLKVAASLVLIGALAAGGYFYLHRNDNKASDTGGINLNPPSQAEKNDTRQHEQASQSASNGSSGSGSGAQQSTAPKKQVTPIITTWGKYDAQNFGVNGFVQDVVEDGGTCTLKMTRQGKTVTETKNSFANVNNTTCGVIEVPYTSVPKGTTWQATLSYDSSTAAGTSSTVTIEVQ